MADLIPPRRDEPIVIEGRPTQRLAKFFELLSRKTNTSAVAASVNADGSAARSQLLELQLQVGSGNFLTSDETGFTVDTDKLTVDMNEA